MSKTKKTFKDYYADEAFRERHLAYMKERVHCECGFETARNNMSKHRKSRNHEKRIQNFEMLYKQAEILKITQALYAK